VTETCEEDLPHLVTHVETTAGPVADGTMTPTIHARLQEKGLLPAQHIVDTGYLDAHLLAESQQDYAVDLFGPTRPDNHWQSRAGEGFDTQSFHIDWEREQATCPEGHTSIGWTPARDNYGTHVLKIKFSAKDCGPCASRSRCIRSVKACQRRTLSIRTKDAYLALQAARQRERLASFSATYAKRAGIEGTLSRGIRRCRLRRTRYIGLARVRLAHALTAAALNFLRLGEWFAGVAPAKTRHSPFALLMANTMVA
jgi:transposase